MFAENQVRSVLVKSSTSLFIIHKYFLGQPNLETPLKKILNIFAKRAYALSILTEFVATKVYK